MADASHQCEQQLTRSLEVVLFAGLEMPCKDLQTRMLQATWTLLHSRGIKTLKAPSQSEEPSIVNCFELATLTCRSLIIQAIVDHADPSTLPHMIDTSTPSETPSYLISSCRAWLLLALEELSLSLCSGLLTGLDLLPNFHEPSEHPFHMLLAPFDSHQARPPSVLKLHWWHHF